MNTAVFPNSILPGNLITEEENSCYSVNPFFCTCTILILIYCSPKYMSFILLQHIGWMWWENLGSPLQELCTITKKCIFQLNFSPRMLCNFHTQENYRRSPSWDWLVEKPGKSPGSRQCREYIYNSAVQQRKMNIISSTWLYKIWYQITSQFFPLLGGGVGWIIAEIFYFLSWEKIILIFLFWTVEFKIVFIAC